MVMSEASFATAVPSPIESPASAAFKAGASFVPSPVTATTKSLAFKSLTKRSLSDGRALAMIFMSRTLSRSSSSESAAKSVPVMMFLSESFSVKRPI